MGRMGGFPPPPKGAEDRLSASDQEHLSSLDSDHSIHSESEKNMASHFPLSGFSASSGGDSSDSGDSLPPLLEFIKDGARQTNEEIRPGDLVKLVNLQMAGLNEQQGYVLGLTPAAGYKEERVEVKMLSGNRLSVKRSNVRPCDCEAETPPQQPSLQKGEEAIVQGLTKDQDTQDTETKLEEDAEDAADVKVPPPLQDPKIQEFHVGDRVRVRSSALCKAFAGRLGRVVPEYSPLAEDRVMIESDQGDRLSFKVVDLEKCEDVQSHRAASESGGDSSDSDDSLPPLEFIDGTRQEVEEIGPGDLVKLVNLQMDALNEEQGYVLRLTPATGYKEERVEVKMLSTGQLLSVKRSNVRSCAVEAERSARSRASSKFPPQQPRLRKGDEVIVQGLTKAFEYNGQRALVLEKVDFEGATLRDGTGTQRVTVELKASGQRMSLRRDKLRKVDVDGEKTDTDSEASDYTDLPALRCIRKAPACKFKVGQKVWLHLKQKPEFHGQAVFVLPSDPLKVAGSYGHPRVTVQLATGKRLVTKEANLRDTPPEVTSEKKDLQQRKNPKNPSKKKQSNNNRMLTSEKKC